MREDLAAAWRNQPGEDRPVMVEDLMRRRTRSLYAATRAEIAGAIGAAVFFVGVIGWRFAAEKRGFPEAAFGAAIVWVLVSLYRFRRRLAPDALAASGLDHYRKELERRRDHLRNGWLWHGPLVLACLTLYSIFGGQRFPAFRSVRSMLPMLILLALWVGFGWFRRRRQAEELQREIDQIAE